jgi:hypothetical protein
VGRGRRGVAALDDWLPRFDVHERHEVLVPVPPERALELVLSIPAGSDPVVRLLIAARGMVARRQPLERFFLAHRFVVLARSPTEFVAGAVGAVWRLRGGLVPMPDADAWRRANVPGTIKAAIDFRAEPAPGGSRLSTETRVAAADARARRVFRAYWLVVGPFSAFIRRRWLAAAMAAANRSVAPPA